MRLVQQSVSKQFCVTCKLRTLQDTNQPERKDQDIRFFKRMLEALTNFQSFMVKS